MSEHQGQGDRKPLQFWTALPSGVHAAPPYGRNLETLFCFCSFTILVADPSPPPRPLLSTEVPLLAGANLGGYLFSL